ncbi:MAG: hypothetical protein U9M94_03350 [Patescibacteria group bacterium]|nr:hypothetical protein [Patescibacteria group bacterium]
MLKKAINFIKYNNAALLILLVIFVIGSGAFAQTEAGQEFIGEKQEEIKGADNILLLDADLENFDMDFKIEKITQDDKYYYVIYTYLDLIKADDAWEYSLNEKIRKVSIKIKKDLGDYLAEELKEEYDARVKTLKQEQKIALEKGEETRTEVIDYSGLIGKTLKLSEKIFFGYESVKTREIPSPAVPAAILAKREIKENISEASTEKPDDLTKIYFDYIEKLEDDVGESSVDEVLAKEPEVNLEIIIDSHPTATTTAAIAIFTFYLNPVNASSTFKCQIDSEDWDDCDLLVEYVDLAVGNHDFAVKTETDDGFILADFSWEIIKEDICDVDNLNLCDETDCASLGEYYIWEYEGCVASTTSDNF